MNENEELEPVHKLGAFTVKVAGQAYTISTIALLLMLAGILIPTAKYAFGLREPTPAQLLVAVSMAMFSAVLFLWILDSTSLLRFRSPWVARSVYAAAITSILGTSVGVYRDAFNESKYPYDGLWEITVWQTSKSEPVAQRQLLMAFSKNPPFFRGFSDAGRPTPPARPVNQPPGGGAVFLVFSPGEKNNF